MLGHPAAAVIVVATTIFGHPAVQRPGRGGIIPASMGRGGSTLLERSQELRQLRKLISGVPRGRGFLCVVEGPAGVGKTTLLSAAGAIAKEAGLEMLEARADLLEVDLPWNLVRQLFAGVIGGDEQTRAELLSGAAALAAPALGLAERRPHPGILHGLYWLTATLSERRPLLIVVDDAHWGDEPSLRFLAYVCERVGELPVAVVVARRTGESTPAPLMALRASRGVTVIPLRELSAAGSATLTRRALGRSAADAFCAACHRATAGNPFLLEALVAELRRDRVEPTAEHASDVARASVGAIRRSVLLWLSRLSAEARRLAGAIAILGECELRDAAALAGLGADDAARAADSLVAASILGPGTPLGFVHPLVREAIYADLPPHQRGREHRHAARIVARAGAGTRRVAVQLLASEPAGDPWVVERLGEGAREALAEGAPGAAADLLERALREPPAGAERRRILLELGRAELAAGRPGAVERLEAAVELSGEPRERGRILLDLGQALYVSGHPRRAAEALERGQAELRGAGDGDPALLAELQAAWLSVARTEVPLRPRAVEVALALAQDPPGGASHGERALMAQVAGELTFAAEPRDRALELARRALGDGALIREETSDGVGWIAAMGALGWGDDFDGYETLQAVAIEDARRRGSVVGFATASYGYSFSNYYRGRLKEAIADAEQAIEAGREGWAMFLPAARAQLAWSLIERGELDAAAAQLRAASDDPTWEQSSMQALVLEARARLCLARGEMQEALDAALEAGRIFDEARIVNPSIAPWRARAAIAAANLNDPERAGELLDEELRLARRFGAPRPIGVALTARGLSGASGATEALEEAVDVLSSSPARLEHARALVALGAALRRRGKAKAARDLLLRGLDLAVQCGAVALEQRARTELIAAGARPRRRRLSGADALTPAELRTAELAAKGMTNREIAESLFVTLRTVETHLTHVYRKLEIDSRTELAARLHPPHAGPESPRSA